MREGGLEAVEIFYECLRAHAETCDGADEAAKLRTAARQIGELCKSLGLSVIVLQPFSNATGLLDAQATAAKRDEFKLWLELANLLGTDLLQIPSTFATPGVTFASTGVTDDRDAIAADLRALADMAAAHDPPMRIAFEALCFSHPVGVVRWQDAWDVIERTQRDNVLLCFDAFHVVGNEQVDTAQSDFERPNGAERVRASMAEFVKTVPAKRIGFVQLGDGERLNGPLDARHPLHSAEMPPLMSWARSCRLFPYEADRGAFTAQQVIFDAVRETGYDGPVSFEIFHAEQHKFDPALPKTVVARAVASWRRLTA